MILRKIQPQDNEGIAKVIRDIFDELNAPKEGTAYADPILDQLFEVYQKPKSIYFVIENEGKVIGGGGLAPLENATDEFCELQKMYFSPQARGLGLGKEIIERSLAFAKEQGFTKCYLETLPYMQNARKLYEKMGFQYLDGPIGCTGHTSCDVWMIKEL
ncbi:GNAT family N-acetyltransferase [Flavobacterium okayamense]|uniref:N-acetyltransferase n=1 Tax=Flavobacterium okayamense TaxID=2830782 RepID=A0ABM7S7S2_9FLAO|nr:GNAT family N-acetyltransferase [Flavobacterium okayamense]BCY29701.1 N-acetyltransferase [Flavobacterium okayamense]